MAVLAAALLAAIYLLRRQVSADGGTSPEWSPDRREIYFRQHDAIFAAQLQFESGGVRA